MILWIIKPICTIFLDDMYGRRSETIYHNVLIVLSVTSGRAVIYASCQPCKVAALGRCSHVVAVLFTLLDHVQEHGAVLTEPCTSRECTWNKGKKKR